jgi:uncharacterized protein (TIGR04222 family)
MNTWGISGPQFLLLYLVAFAVTVLGVVLAGRRALASDGGAAGPAHLDPYEAAELNGGGALVATTAVSNLLRSGRLASSSRRRGQPARLVTGKAPGPRTHPVEWAVYQAVADGPNRRLKDVQAALEGSSALAAVRERLRRAGLAPTPEQRARCRAAGLLFLPLLALGVARVVAGSANGRPVGFLVALLVVTVVVAAVLVLRVPNATGLGRRTLQRLRAEQPRPSAGASPAELSMGTALFGAGALWAADTDTAVLLRIPREHGVFGADAGGGGFAGGGFGGGDGGGGGGGGGGGCGGGGCGG